MIGPRVSLLRLGLELKSLWGSKYLAFLRSADLDEAFHLRVGNDVVPVF